jgi:hypothetical protein
MQYVHHFGTERHVLRGTRNLWLCAPIDWIWLNHNWHFTHHLHPTMPWVYLQKVGHAEGPKREPILWHYLRMWRGPRYTDDRADKASAPAAAVWDLSVRRRLAMVVLGFLPLMHGAFTVALAVMPIAGLWPHWMIGLAPVALYVLPPVVVRVVLLARPLSGERFPVDSKEFLIWWFFAQWQMLFSRLPFLEEVLRLFPGLYSLWLRLWGAKVGALVYWAPSCRLLDRQLIEVGDRVVFGVGARLHPHVITRENGETLLILAPVRIGDDAMIGGFSLLTAGTRVHAGEMVPAAQALPPFSEWRHGTRARRVRPMIV